MGSSAESKAKHRTCQNIRGVVHTHGDASKGYEERPEGQRKPDCDWTPKKRQCGNQRRPRRVTGREGVGVGFPVDSSPVSFRAAASYGKFGCHNQNREDEDGSDETNRQVLVGWVSESPKQT